MDSEQIRQAFQAEGQQSKEGEEAPNPVFDSGFDGIQDDRSYRTTPTPPERNNPGYTPEYKELEEARRNAESLWLRSETDNTQTCHAVRWLAAEVRVMRLERALER